MPVDKIPFRPRYPAEAAPFWQACAREEFVLPGCRRCGRLFWPAGVVCPHCLSGDVAWEPAPREGTIYSYTVFHRAFDKRLEEALPYTVVSVELADGVLFNSNLINAAPDWPACGKKVRLVWRKLDGEVVLPLFQPDG